MTGTRVDDYVGQLHHLHDVAERHLDGVKLLNNAAAGHVVGVRVAVEHSDAQKRVRKLDGALA